MQEFLLKDLYTPTFESNSLATDWLGQNKT